MDGELIDLDWTKLWCDVFEFRRLSTPGQADAESLEAAAQFYREPFLSGFDLPDSLEFERWMSEERSALESLYLEDLSQLIGLSAARQDYARAITYAQQYLTTDGLAEEVHHRLILYYALAGFRTKDLRQYETCVTVLEQELGPDSPLGQDNRRYNYL